MIKKIGIILILIICLFTISAVSAEEIENSTNVISSENNSDMISEPIDNSSYGNFSELQEKINATEEGGTLNLTKNYKYESGDVKGIVIQKSIIINGNGHILNGSTSSKIFNITSDNVILNNLIFTEGYSSYGGAVYWEGNNGTLKNCTLYNNNVHYDALYTKESAFGGAIFWQGNNGNIINSFFINNTAVSGGAIYFLSYEGRIITSSFINNSLYESYYIDAPSWTQTGSFGGGAIFSREENITIYKSEFINNNANNSVLGGGAIFSYGNYLIISDSNFTNNTGVYAGAIRCEAKYNTINSSNFYYNKADYYGGAVSSPQGNTKIINSWFFDNYANYWGIDVWLNHDDEIFNTTFIMSKRNSTEIIYCEGYNNKIINCIFIIPKFEDYDIIVRNENVLDYMTFVLPFDAKGVLNLTIDNKTYSTNVAGGVASFNLEKLKHGNYSSIVVYSGDDFYAPRILEQNITKIPNFNLNVANLTKYFRGNERLIVSLREKNNNPILNAEVKITINGQTYTRTIDSFGQTSMAINLNSGVYNVTTEYDGIKVYSTVTIKDTVIANDFTKMYKNGTQYYGTFLDSQGNILKGADIEININGVLYHRTTDENGVARMNINLNPGTYVLTAYNPTSGERHTTTITVLPTIVENHDLIKYYKNSSQYTLRLLGPDGKPVGAGESVTLNINGVFYTRTSNASGYVKMNINLAPGTYIITADYNGLKASNTITVKSVLFANDLYMKYRDGSKFEAKVLDGQGRPLAGVTVTFNVNGVFYTKVTEDDGIARLTINLRAGNYIITSSFNGLNAANNIIIAQNPMYYTIGSNPLDYNYYMDEYNRFTWDWFYNPQDDAYERTIYDIYGNSGTEFQTVSYGTKYVCYEPSTGKEIALNSAGEVISMSINRDYTEDYILYDKFNNELGRGRWINGEGLEEYYSNYF